MVGGDDEIVSRLTLKHLGFENFIGIKGIVDDFNAGFGGEVGKQLGVDIVRPIVEVQHLRLVRRLLTAGR